MSRDHCVTFRDNRDSSCGIRSPPPAAPIIFPPPQTISFRLGVPGTSALQGQEGARTPRALSSSCLLFFSQGEANYKPPCPTKYPAMENNQEICV